MRVIIGLAGQKQSGKSTAYSYIASIVDGKVFEYSFAECLKIFCMTTLGLTHKQCNGTDEEKNSLTEYNWEEVDLYFRRKYATVYRNELSEEGNLPRTGRMTSREVMQIQGEMQREMFCKNIWIKPISRQMCRYDEHVHVITDLRHKNEIDEIDKLGGYVIHFAKQTNNDNAASEMDLLYIDWNKYPRVFAIDNTNMTIEEKNAEIKNILSQISGIELR